MNLTKVNQEQIEVKEFKNIRVVTLKDIDKVHQRPEGTASKRFLDNKKRFISGVDYFQVTGADLEKIKRIPNFGIGLNASKTLLLTESGYLMLVKSFTDELAWQVQRDLVNNYFRKSEINLYQSMSKELQAILMIDEKTQQQDERISKLENTMTIDYNQQQELHTIANRAVIKILGGKDTPAYKELSKKAFASIWRDFKRIMGVNSYRNTAVKEFERAVGFLKEWKPNRGLSLMITGANSQLILDVE